MTFRIGDQVEIIKVNAVSPFCGKRGRIVETRVTESVFSKNDRFARYIVDVEGHGIRWFNEKELELIGTEMTKSFHNGKSVTVNCISSKWHGQRGVIIQSTRVRDSQGKWTHLVEFSPTSRQWFPEYELCGNDEKKTEEPSKLPHVAFRKLGTVPPIVINILLAIHCCPPEVNDQGTGILRKEVWHSSAASDARIWLYEKGLINFAANGLTDKGQTWLNAILSVPLPVSRETWEIPEA